MLKPGIVHEGVALWVHRAHRLLDASIPKNISKKDAAR